MMRNSTTGNPKTWGVNDSLEEGNPEGLPLLVSPTRAARELALSRYTIYELIQNGSLAAVRAVGRRIAIRREVLIEFAESRPAYRAKGQK